MINGKTKRHAKLSTRHGAICYVFWNTRCSVQSNYETALRSCRLSMDHRLVGPCGLQERRIHIKSTGMLINMMGMKRGRRE